MKIELGEETREIVHPTKPDLRVLAVVPDRLLFGRLLKQITPATDQVNSTDSMVENMERQQEALASILRGIVGQEGGTPKEWAAALSRPTYQFEREDYVAALNVDGVIHDPDAKVPLAEGEYRVWQHPDTLHVGHYLWDKEADAPVKRKRIVNFADYIMERTLRPDEADSGKGSPTLSAAR